MSNPALSIANTIRDQIGTNTLMCVAAHQLMVLRESEKYRGGLTFKVGRNPKLKGGGRVTVVLNFNDTYTVKVENNRGKVLLEASDVYCDMLAGPSGVIEGVTG